MNTDQRIRHLRQSGLSKSAVAAVLNVDPSDISGALLGQDVVLPTIPQVISLTHAGPTTLHPTGDYRALPGVRSDESQFYVDFGEPHELADGIYKLRAGYFEIKGSNPPETDPPRVGIRLLEPDPDDWHAATFSQGPIPSDWTPSYSVDSAQATFFATDGATITLVAFAYDSNETEIMVRNMHVSFDRVVALD